MLDSMFLQAVSEQETAVASDYERAALLGRLEEYEQAQAVYEALIKRQPQDALAYAGKGNMLLFLQRPEAALIAYAHALSWLRHSAQPGLAEPMRIKRYGRIRRLWTPTTRRLPWNRLGPLRTLAKLASCWNATTPGRR